MNFDYNRIKNEVYLHLMDSDEEPIDRSVQIHDALFVHLNLEGLPVGVEFSSEDELGLSMPITVDKVVDLLKAETTEVLNGAARSFEGGYVTAEHLDSVRSYADLILNL